jgi:hypothetical protein
MKMIIEKSILVKKRFKELKSIQKMAVSSPGNDYVTSFGLGNTDDNLVEKEKNHNQNQNIQHGWGLSIGASSASNFKKNSENRGSNEYKIQENQTSMQLEIFIDELEDLRYVFNDNIHLFSIDFNINLNLYEENNFIQLFIQQLKVKIHLKMMLPDKLKENISATDICEDILISLLIEQKNINLSLSL